MRRDEFEHVIAAAAEVAGEREIVVIGSQAILGCFPEPPETMLFSAEADVYPLNDPAKAESIDGSLGDGSYFLSSQSAWRGGTGTGSSPATPSQPTSSRSKSCSAKFRNSRNRRQIGSTSGRC